MRILFVANDLNKPSHLWMRRQLHGLGSSVAAVACNGAIEWQGSARCRHVKLQSDSSLWRRALNRFGVGAADDVSTVNARRIGRALRLSDIDAVLLHYVNRAVMYRDALSATAKPVFVHCHGYDVTWDLRHYEGQRIGLPFHPQGYTDAVRQLPDNVRFIANSRRTMQRLENIGIPSERIMVKHLGVEIPEAPPEQQQRSRSVAILYLGRLVDCKAPDMVLRAFECACERGLDGHLTLAGDGPLRLTCELIRARSPYKDRMTFLGEVDAVRGQELRSQADIFTAHNCLGPVSRQEEAFGVSIVEAMAAGVPVVTGKNGSIPDVLRHGEEGLLFEPGDVGGHAEALLHLARDPALRKRLGRAGWMRARDHFSLDAEITRLREILATSVPSYL